MSTNGRQNSQKEIQTTIELLANNFHKPLAQVSKELEVCMTLIKRVCRKHGITRWPYRKATPLRALPSPFLPDWLTRSAWLDPRAS